MCRKHAAAASHAEATRAAHNEASASLAAHVKRRAKVAAALAAILRTLQPQAPCNQGEETHQTPSLHASQSEAPAELPAPKRSARRGASTAAEQDPGCCPGTQPGFETAALERAAAAAPRMSAMRLAATIEDSPPFKRRRRQRVRARQHAGQHSRGLSKRHQRPRCAGPQL